MTVAVVGPSGTVAFVTCAKHVAETTPAFTALNTQLAEHDLAPHHGQSGDPIIVNSLNQDTPSVHSFPCIDIGSSASLSLFQLRCSDVGVLNQQGLPVEAPNLLFS